MGLCSRIAPLSCISCRVSLAVSPVSTTAGKSAAPQFAHRLDDMDGGHAVRQAVVAYQQVGPQFGDIQLAHDVFGILSRYHLASPLFHEVGSHFADIRVVFHQRHHAAVQVVLRMGDDKGLCQIFAYCLSEPRN